MENNIYTTSKDEEIIGRYFKLADTIQNRIIIPKWFVDEHGRNFYMEIYKDYIKLIPVEKLNKQDRGE